MSRYVGKDGGGGSGGVQRIQSKKAKSACKVVEKKFTVAATPVCASEHT